MSLLRVLDGHSEHPPSDAGPQVRFVLTAWA
jgi:hypothetical protein